MEAVPVSETQERGESALLAVFLIASAFFFVGSFQFPLRAALFPRIMALGVIVLGSLLLVRQYLPDRLRAVLLSGESAGQFEDVPGQDIDEQDLSVSDDEGTGQRRFLQTILLTTGLVLGSYVFGMLWTAPLFVVAYGTLTDTSRRGKFTGAVVVFVFIALLVTYYNIELDQGLWGPQLRDVLQLGGLV